MRVLVLGGGGREHALCWKIARSPGLTKLWCAPGNAGIEDVAECVALNVLDSGAVVAFCRDHAIDLLVVGPEAPLEAGVSDAARAAGFAVFGPSKAAAMLETSKSFTKAVCDACAAPTASYAVFQDPDAAKDHIRQNGAPIVVKADGLAAGKGVVVAETEADALAAVDMIFDGPGGGTVVLEEMLLGEEASFFVLTDGEAVLALAGAQDHKRAYDGDTGPNTGGMGAYSPAPVFTPEIERQALDRIIEPILGEMRARGTPYSGVLYAGLILTADGPKLIEINARFGDPECQCILPRMTSDLLPLLQACASGTLAGHAVEWDERACLNVVMAAKGYPADYRKGTVIEGVATASKAESTIIFHAGTKRDGDQLLATGGRVLNICGLGHSIAEARDRAYDAISKITWNEGFCRSDIGWRALRED